MTKPELTPQNEVVNAFRDAINEWFSIFLDLYELTTTSMKNYRMRHVELIADIYNGLMKTKGDVIEQIRRAAYYLDDLIDEKREELGRINECLQGIINTRNSNSAAIGTNIQRCALIANQTLSRNLDIIFYPAFAEVQEQASIIPISVIDVLSRGNVLEDEQEVLTFLEKRHNALTLQWIYSVSTILTWETNRFRNEGLFLQSDMDICMNEAAWEYLLLNYRLESEIQDC
jgi:hypothetical protein